MNPPLRLESDRLAVIEGLKSGVISVIATDYAPHHADEKNVERSHKGSIRNDRLGNIAFTWPDSLGRRRTLEAHAIAGKNDY